MSVLIASNARDRNIRISNFEVLDAFDVRAALDLGVQFTKIYSDMSGLSGCRSLLDAIALLTMYATVVRPEAVIIKSGALKHFASYCTLLVRCTRQLKIEELLNEGIAHEPFKRAIKRENRA